MVIKCFLLWTIKINLINRFAADSLNILHFTVLFEFILPIQEICKYTITSNIYRYKFRHFVDSYILLMTELQL